MLPDGSRLHVVIPDITRAHWSVNVRKFVVKAGHLDDLVTLGTLTPTSARFLEMAVTSGLNVLVSGGTQAGKTTLLNCLGAAVPPQERVVTCEEVFELKIPLPDVVAMQCRQPSLEGIAEQAAPVGEGSTSDAAVTHHRRRGTSGGEPRPVEVRHLSYGLVGKH
jgi:pilus assembly protein CpaF